VDVWSAAALKFEEPKHTDAWNLTAQGFAECLEIALYIVTIVRVFSRIREGEHSGELYIGVGRYKGQALAALP
jgi:hypothetical protein